MKEPDPDTDFDMTDVIEQENLATDEARPTFDVYKSKLDGVWVVHVQTDDMPENENGPILRVYINDDTDDPAYANPPISSASERSADA